MSRENYTNKNKGNPVSYSRLSTFNGCEYEYYLSYKLKKPRRDNIYGKIGGVTHDIVQSMQQGLIDNKQGLKRFVEAIEEVKMFDYSFPSETVEKNFVECVSHYIENFKPIEYKSQEVELGYDVYIGETKTLVLGFIDLLIHRENGDVEIYDYKTSSKYSAKDFQEHKLQLLGYAKGVEKQYGIKVNRVAFDMMKYCDIEYINSKGKAKQYVGVERNKIGSKMRAECEKILSGITGADLILDEFEKTNIIPEILKDRIKILNHYKDVDLSEVDEFDDFVDKTIYKIQEKDKTLNFKPKYITEKTSFYCNVLCGQRNNCKYYKYFIDNDLRALKQEDTEDDANLF